MKIVIVLFIWGMLGAQIQSKQHPHDPKGYCLQQQTVAQNARAQDQLERPQLA